MASGAPPLATNYREGTQVENEIEARELAHSCVC